MNVCDLISFIIILIIIFFVIRETQSIHFRERVFGIIETHESANYYVAEKINENNNVEGNFTTSLFGDDTTPYIYERYVLPLLDTIEKAKIHMSSWGYIVYIDPQITQKTKENLLDSGATLYIMNKSSKGTEGSMWRFLAASENKPFICLDSDDDAFNRNKFEPREPFWVDHIIPWLNSDKTFFQHRIYCINMVSIPITAKYWGGKANSIPNIEDLINMYCASWYGNDEAFLAKEVWPILKQDRYTYSNNCEFLVYFILIVFIVWILQNG